MNAMTLRRNFLGDPATLRPEGYYLVNKFIRANKKFDRLISSLRRSSRD